MTVDAARARAALDALHALGAMANAGTPIHCRLMTANGSATAAGTELATSGGYTATNTGSPSVTMAAASSPATAASTTAVTVTNMPATTIVGIELTDNAGVRQELGALGASKTTASGDTLSFAIGAITSALS